VSQVPWQAPEEQTSPAPQATLQLPQLAGSLVTSTHPAVHDTSPEPHVQTPALQVVPGAQVMPQLPQLVESLVGFRHVPEQSIVPAGHPLTACVFGWVGEQPGRTARQTQAFRVKDRKGSMPAILTYGAPFIEA
jgi:hypothetical protein